MYNIIDLFKLCSTVDVHPLKKLSDKLLFLNNAINLVVGESKSGKTYTVIKSLSDAGFKDKIIHVDFDRNGDEKLSQLGIETFHIRDANEFITSLKILKSSNVFDISDSFRDKIFVIDSLQDLSTEDGIDSNKGALSAMQNVLLLAFTGATIVLIHHTTIDMSGKAKVKGNSSVITSKCDTTILFQRINNTKRTMTVLNTRAEDKIPSGTMISYMSDDQTSDQQMTSKPRQNDHVLTYKQK
jgi:predicted ATP-dependent serine protease